MEVISTCASEIGIKPRQAIIMSWSKRKRGRLQRTHMKMKTTATVFPKKTPERTMHSSRLSVTDGLVGSTCPFRNGRCHPPKKSATQTADVVIMPAYSARKKRANRIEL